MTGAARPMMLIVCLSWAGCIVDLGRAGLQAPPDAGDAEAVPETPETPDPTEDLADPDDAESEPAPLYGRLDIDFSTPFILDEAQLGESTYMDAHPNAIIQRAASTGSYGTSRSIPSAEAETTMSYAYQSVATDPFPARVTVGQQSADGDGNNVNPLVGLVLMFDDIAVRDYPVELTGDEQIQLLVYNVTAPDGSSMCVIAIGIGGNLRVSAASNTSAQDGGTLAMTATGLPLYYPTETPIGDLTESILAGGYTVCVRE